MVSGCTGGAFFKEDFSWFDFTPDHQFYINWHLIPDLVIHTQPMEAWSPLVNPAALATNKWWLWDDQTRPMLVRRPIWWDAKDQSVLVCYGLHF